MWEGVVKATPITPFKMNKKYIKKANSHAPLLGWTPNSKEATVFPDFSFQAVINMVNNDPVARGAINHFVDKCMEGDYNIVNLDKPLQADSKEKLRLNQKYRFRDQIMKKAFLLGRLFNNIYIELVRTTEGGIKALNVLDSMNIEPITEPNGDPLQFKTRTPNHETGVYTYWSANDIVWMKLGDRSIGYAPVDLRALWENLLAKDYVKRYVAWLWKTGQYRLIYNFKQAGEQDINDFIVYNKKHDDNYTAPFLAKGEMETKVLRDMKETESLVELFKYYDSQTLILLRVPPIDAGIPDASGRSNADAQNNNIAATVTSWKKTFEDTINFELFPRMFKGNQLLKFGPNNRFEIKQIMENVNTMKNIGMTEQAIKEYLSDVGMFWDTDTLFADPVKEAMKMAKATQSMTPDVEQPGIKKDIDTMPSRIKKADGDKGEPKTREDQLKKV